MAETEGSDDTSENELLNRSLSVWKGNKASKEEFEPIPLDLHTASSLGLHDCVKAHIIRGEVDIDKINKGGWTALMYACYIGHESIVSLLLERGASVNLRNRKKETPLMLAASCGNDRVGRLLCSQGAELEYRDARGWTALFHATYSGHQNMVSFLLKQGANMNAVEPSVGMTPFMEAAAEGHEIILQLFLQHGVNVNAKAYNGDTARSLALINGNMKIVSLIDNHVMPITSLRAEAGLETDLSSSDDIFSRRNKMRQGRGKHGGGPSIMDGPQAIARLIDRTRDTPQPKVAGHDVLAFPETSSAQQPQKLSFRDVTSPINPDDYNVDSSGSRDYSEPDMDDTNAFSKTGALTIKSSSGSSGGLAAAFGIRREDSLDSDDFPHESSCGDSHHQGNSGESSSDEGLEDNTETSPVDATLKTGPKNKTKDMDNEAKDVESKDKKGELEKIKIQSKKSKELRLTAEKVSEIEVMKNSVSEWIDSVHNSHPESHFESHHLEEKTDDGHEKEAAIKPEYLPKKNPSKSPSHERLGYQSSEGQGQGRHNPGHNPGHSRGQSHSANPREQAKPSQQEPKHLTGAELIEQVAHNLKNYDPRPSKEFLQSHSSPVIQDSAIISVAEHSSIPPVSALNILNTEPKEYSNVRTSTSQSFDQGHHSSYHSDGSQSMGHSQHNSYHGDPSASVGQGHYSSYHGAQSLSVDQGHLDSYHGNQHKVVSAPPGFSAAANPYPMYQGQVPSGVGIYTSVSMATQQHSSSLVYSHGHNTGNGDVGQSSTPSSNAVFLDKMKDCMPPDLPSLLEQLGLSKYMPTFEEQDVDLQVFLSLTDNDLKEIGIKLFGPRKKMMNAIARWHSKARIAVGELEQAYADRLEGEMQEMGLQLQVAVEQLEKLKAQVKQEQQLRNVTESCLMEERGAWQQVQRIIMETRQQCEDFKDIVRKMIQYVGELKSRVHAESGHSQGQKRPVRGSSAIKDERGVVGYETMTTDAVVRKVDYYMEEITHLLGTVTNNTDRLLGRSSADSPERPYT